MLKKTILNLSVIVACIVPMTSAHAEEVVATQDVTNVFDRARPDYDALGVRFGSFVFKPTIATSEQYYDNIYATTNNTKEDFITHINPSLNLASDWSNHSLAFNATGDVSKYANNTAENYNDFSVGTKARIDVLRETSILLGAGYDKKHEDRGSAEANTVNSITPTEYSNTSANLGLYHGINRVSISLDNKFDQIDFDNGKTAAGVVLNNNGRNRDEYKSSAKVAYELTPGYSAFVRGTYLDKQYNNLTTLNRDSNGYDLDIGTDLDIGGKTKGEIFVGYYNREYTSATLPDTTGLSFGADVIWDVTALTSINANVTRSIEETTLSGASGYLSTQYKLNLEHELLRNVLIGTSYTYVTNQYNGALSGAVERNDDISIANAKVGYLLGRNIKVNTTYSYTNRDSNISSGDYSSNSIMVGLAFAL